VGSRRDFSPLALLSGLRAGVLGPQEASEPEETREAFADEGTPGPWHGGSSLAASLRASAFKPGRGALPQSPVLVRPDLARRIL